MARKIKETPVLTGKDAARFEKVAKANETRKVSTEDYNRAQETFNRISLKKSCL